MSQMSHKIFWLWPTLSQSHDWIDSICRLARAVESSCSFEAACRKSTYSLSSWVDAKYACSGSTWRDCSVGLTLRGHGAPSALGVCTRTYKAAASSTFQKNCAYVQSPPDHSRSRWTKCLVMPSLSSARCCFLTTSPVCLCCLSAHVSYCSCASAVQLFFHRWDKYVFSVSGRSTHILSCESAV